MQIPRIFGRTIDPCMQSLQCICCYLEAVESVGGLPRERSQWTKQLTAWSDVDVCEQLTW